MKNSVVKIKIPFYDIDKLELVWFGNYFKYFDLARSQLLQDLKIDIFKKKKILWPVIETKCTYFGNINHEDEIEVEAKLIKNSFMIKIEYNIFRKKKKIASGYTKQIPVDKHSNYKIKKIPKDILNKIYEK